MTTITGTNRSDLVAPRESADIISGLAGNDTLYGGRGGDQIGGGEGNDYELGGKGGDRLYGAAGNDYQHGNLGADTLDGGTGNDWLRGGQESDTLYGGGGSDTIQGDKGDDRIYTSDSGDTAQHSDSLFGGEGSDQIWGSRTDPSLDIAYGGAGNDWIEGVDVAHGEGGDDLMVDAGEYHIGSEPGADRIIDHDGYDNLLVFVEMGVSAPADEDGLFQAGDAGVTSYADDSGEARFNWVELNWAEIFPDVEFHGAATLRIDGVMSVSLDSFEWS